MTDATPTYGSTSTASTKRAPTPDHDVTASATWRTSSVTSSSSPKHSATLQASDSKPDLSRATSTPSGQRRRSKARRTSMLSRTRSTKLLFPDFGASTRYLTHGEAAAAATAAAAAGAARTIESGSEVVPAGRQSASYQALRDESSDEDEHKAASTGGSSVVSSASAPSTTMACWSRVINSPFVISLQSPYGRKRRYWNLLVFVFVLFNAVSIPFMFTFRRVWSDTRTLIGLHLMEYLGDVIFLFDLVLCFYTPFNDEGFVVTDLKAVKQHYFRTWFRYDALASLPLGLITFNPWKHALLRMPRLIRLLKVGEYFEMWEHYAMRWLTEIRFAKLFTGLLLFVHWYGCLYITINYNKDWGEHDDCGEECWLAGPEDPVQDASLSSQYLFGIFWAANILLGVGGEPHPPDSDFERVCSLIVAITSIFIVALIIGNVADLIAQMGHRDELFRQKMERLNLFMHSRRLPPRLRQDIRDYFVNIIQQRGGLDDASVLDELPVSLKTEAINFLNRDIIRKAPIFRDCSTGFINALVGYLKPHIYSPNSYIVRRGEVGSEMYFIRRGQVQVVGATGEIVAVLHEGGFFGEIALLENNSKRTASIKSATYCDLFVLTKADLDGVFKLFPDERDVILAVADTRRSKDLLRQRLHSDSTLRTLPDDVLQAFVDAWRPSMHAECEAIITAGEEKDRLVFLGKGSVLITRSDAAISASNTMRDVVSLARARKREQERMPRSASTASVASQASSASVPQQAHSVASASSFGGFLPRRSATFSTDLNGIGGDQSRVIATLGRGSFFGGLVGHPHSVNAEVSDDVSQSPCIVFTLHRESLELLEELHSDYAQQFREFAETKRSWTAIATGAFRNLLHRKKHPLHYLSSALTGVIKKHPELKNTAANIASLWLKKLGYINNPDLVEVELDKLSPEQLLLASECVQRINNHVTRELFARAG